MNRKDSAMVRLPKDLINELQAYALTLADQLDPARQGNHEDPRSWAPPLWRVIKELLKRDQDHRNRSRKDSVKKTTIVATDSEGGIKGHLAN